MKKVVSKHIGVAVGVGTLIFTFAACGLKKGTKSSSYPSSYTYNYTNPNYRYGYSNWDTDYTTTYAGGRNNTHNNNTPHVWGATETAMNEETTNGRIESIRRLEIRYPQAARNRIDSIRQVVQMVRDFVPPNQERRFKKEAALRFLDRVQVRFTGDNPAGNRNIFPNYTYPIGPAGADEVVRHLALAWYAVTDNTIFTPVEVEDRKNALLNSLATIQRAHNDNNPARRDAIIWDEAVQRDQPSCNTGTLKGLMEHLDRSHPDVLLNPAVAVPTLADVSLEVFQQNAAQFGAFWANIPHHDQGVFQRMVENYENDVVNNHHYQQYVARIKAGVRRTAPNVPENLLTQATEMNAMCALISALLP